MAAGDCSRAGARPQGEAARAAHRRACQLPRARPGGHRVTSPGGRGRWTGGACGPLLFSVQLSGRRRRGAEQGVSQTTAGAGSAGVTEPLSFKWKQLPEGRVPTAIQACLTTSRSLNWYWNTYIGAHALLVGRWYSIGGIMCCHMAATRAPKQLEAD